jgi:catechol 2,3-dioxygenase-like lactoylglutathione lyase family enzyme
LAVVTLFVEDLDVAKEFYQRAFDLPVHYEDADSVVFSFGGTLINLLIADEALDLIAPAAVAPSSSGSRLQFTLSVDDVDTAAAELVERGVVLLNGPMDRPWGIRTVSFQDPDGHIWELAH